MAATIDFFANVTQFLRGTKDAEDALGDVSSSLDDLARDGRQAGDKLGDGIKDGAKTAARSVDDLDRTFKDLADSSKKEFKTAGDQVGTNIKRGTQEAEGGVKDLGEESKATAKETAASFDGSADSIVGAFQEVAANAFAGFGPAGLVAGLAAAAGIGLIVAAMGTAGDATEDVKAHTAELAQEYISTGDLGVASMDYLISRLQDLATESEDGKTNLGKLADIAKRSGSSFQDLAQAYAGNTDQLKDLWREGDKRQTQLELEAETASRTGALNYGSLLRQAAAQEEYTNYVGQSIGVAEKAAEAQKLYAQAGGAELEQKAEAVKSIQGGVDDAAGSWEVYSDKEKTALDPAQYLANVQARISAAAGYAANLATAQAQLNPAAYQYLVDQGVDFAPMLQSILDSGMVDQFNSTFTQAAAAGNSAIDGTLQTDLDVGVTVTADVVTPEKALNTLASTKRAAEVEAKVGKNTASNDLDAIATKTRTAHIGTQLDGEGGVERAIDRLVRDRTVTITARIVDSRTGRLVP